MWKLCERGFETVCSHKTWMFQGSLGVTVTEYQEKIAMNCNVMSMMRFSYIVCVLHCINIMFMYIQLDKVLQSFLLVISKVSVWL